MNLSTEIEFLTHLINIEKRLKDGYTLSITRHWDYKYIIVVVELSKCDPLGWDDPFVLQLTSDFCFLNMFDGVRKEVTKFYSLLEAHNLLKND